MDVLIQQLQPNAKIPTYAHEHDAGMDLYALHDQRIPSQSRTEIDTGIAMAIPAGYVGLVWDKSGLAINVGLKTMAGVIDADYRGEIRVVIFNTSTEVHEVKAGQKIAQLLIQPIVNPNLITVETLPDSERGEKGFGSSGI